MAKIIDRVKDAAKAAKKALAEPADIEYGEDPTVVMASKLFSEFYEGTKSHRDRARENEKYWKRMHWDNKPLQDGKPQPVTPVLFSTCENMKSDMMDRFPEAVIVPMEPDDTDRAEEISELLKHRFADGGYQNTYKETTHDMIVKGTGITRVYWDPDVRNIGDVAFERVSILNFLWDPLVDDIQEGRACFTYGTYTREWLKRRYPDKAENIKPGLYTAIDEPDNIKGYIGNFGDTPNDSDLILVYEYWYKEYKDGVATVHMAQIAGNTLLDHTTSVYEHGLFPFVVEPMFRFEGEPVGFGIIDEFKPLQDYADKLDQIIMDNALRAGKMKMIVARSAGIDADELRDGSQELIYGNSIDDGSFRWFQVNPLPGFMHNYKDNMLDMIKLESGANEFSRGEAGKGVTAASAIVALQESSAKRTRMLAMARQDRHREIARMALSLMAQYYTEGRVVRIRGGERTAEIKGSDLRYKTSEGAVGRVMDWDIKIEVQVRNPFSVLQHNELMLQQMQAGTLRPVQALELMIFEGKDRVLRMARENEQTQQLMEAMKGEIDRLAAENMQLQEMAGQAAQQAQQAGQALQGVEQQALAPPETT